MKKLLALVLALVMTLSLCVTSNAAYTDAADIDYKEAVDVMSAVGVLQGSDGKFSPDDGLTRAQAAKIIAYLDLGNTAAEALTKDVTAFTDVPAGHWAAGYITYCFNAGIIDGVGNKQFAPDAQLTALQFAKMLLVVLGYNAKTEGLTGADWSLNTAKLAAENSLFKGNDAVAVNAVATRQEAAQYAFNALKADCVKYATATTTVKGDGLEVTVGGSAAEAYTAANCTTVGFANGNLQLGEKLYSGKLTAITNADDDLDRPSTKWTYKGVSVGTYVDTADYTFVVTKTNKTYEQMITALNSDLKFTATIAGATVNTYWSLNGAANGVNGTAANNTTNGPKVGDVVEVFLNNNSDAQLVTDVIVTRYFVDEVTGAVQTKTTDGVDYVRVPGVVNSYKEVDNVKGYKDLAKNDIVYGYTADGTTYLFKAEKFTGKATAFTAATSSALAKVTVDGKQYQMNQNIGTLTNSSLTYNVEYDFYTDNNGYLIYAEATEVELSDYVVLQKINWVDASGVNNTGYAEARLVKMDGTTEVVKVAEIDDFKTTGCVDLDDLADGNGFYTGAQSTAAAATAAVSTNATGSLTNATATKFYAFTAASGTAPLAAKYVAIGAATPGNAALENNAFFTYEVNSDGDYELTTVATNSAKKISVGVLTNQTVQNKSSKIGSLAVDENTVFVVAKTSGGKTFEVYTGKSAVPTLGTSAANGAYVAKSGVATYVFISTFSQKVVEGNKVLFLSATPTFNAVKDGTTTYYYNEYAAVVNGEIGTVKVKANSDGSKNATGNVATGTVITPTYDKYGVATVLADHAFYAGEGFGYSYANGTLTVDAGAAETYSCDGDTVLYYKDVDGNYVKGTFADYASDDNDRIYVVKKTTDTSAVDYAYVQYVDDTALVPTLTVNGNAAAIKALADGAYVPAGKAFAGDVSGNAADNRIFKFTTGISQDYTLTIKDGGGNIVYTEPAGSALTANTSYFFYITLNPANTNKGTESGAFNVAGAVAADTYEYTITGADSTVVFSGSFNVD